MKNLKKYGYYTFLSVAVFIAFWLMGGFISTEYNLNKWGAEWRFCLIWVDIVITGCTIGHHETT